MASTLDSRRTVFRQIASRSYADWPVYDSTPLYDRTSVAALEADVRTVAQTWFRHDDHTAIEQFVCILPLAYFKFSRHDRYTGSTSYGMDTLFRLFVLKECYGWDHETALVEYLHHHPSFCDQLGLDTVPDQSTLWRSWNKRFTANLRRTVETAARTILIKAQNAGIAVPREPERKLCYQNSDDENSTPDEQSVLERAEMISQRGLSYVVPKRMQTSEKAQAKRLLQRDQDRYETDRKLHLRKNEWHETMLIYRRKEGSEHDDHRQYSVFMTNRGSGHLTEYGYRWEIESGYKSIKRFMAATTSKDFGLRFFYFAFACLLYSIWRVVDLLVQVELTGAYERSPVITADNTLTLLKKETGIG